MKFSDELGKLKAGFEAGTNLAGKADDAYYKGFLAGIGFAKEHVRRLESSHRGAIETLKQNIKRFFR